MNLSRIPDKQAKSDGIIEEQFFLESPSDIAGGACQQYVQVGHLTQGNSSRSSIQQDLLTRFVQKTFNPPVYFFRLYKSDLSWSRRKNTRSALDMQSKCIFEACA
jgi:hypothetical protein